jgi:hypothetical protein
MTDIIQTNIPKLQKLTKYILMGLLKKLVITIFLLLTIILHLIN